MKIIEKIEMTQEERALCETAAIDISMIRSNLCDGMSCNGMACEQCPINKATEIIAQGIDILGYVARYGTDKGFEES